MTRPRIYATSFASVYPLYVKKAEKKGRARAEVDEIVRWLTGYSQAQLEARLEQQTDLETFLIEAPEPNPARSLITGMVCGVRIEDIDDPLMREIRYMDRLIDELAKGRPMAKILRKSQGDSGVSAGSRHAPNRPEPATSTGSASRTDATP